MDNPLLKTIVQTNIALTLSMHKRLAKYPDKYNEGQFQYMYIFIHEGKEYVHYASQAQEKQLNIYNPGDELQLVKQEYEPRKTKYVWTDTTGAEARAAAAPQALSNTKQRTEEKKGLDRDMTEKIRYRCMAQAGAGQAYISGYLGSPSIDMRDWDSNQLIKDAVEFGVAFAKANRERAKADVINEEKS